VTNAEDPSKVRKKLTKKQVKVLYICPFAHYSGHPPAAAINEPEALRQAGAEVKLVTFCGIIDDTKARVPEVTIVPRRFKKVHRVFRVIRKWTLSRWVLMFSETISTLIKALAIKRREGYDVIYLRDGEPFLFMSHIVSLPFRGVNWIVSLTAANIYMPKPPPIEFRNLPLLVYSVVMNFVINNRLWRPLYRLSLKRNNFRFVTQNELAKEDYSNYLGGIFGDRVQCLPIGVASMNRNILTSKEEARRILGLPQHKPLFLSFGAPHSGKDLDVIYRVFHGMRDVHLVQAGKQAFSLGVSPALLLARYNMEGRVIVKDYYITEEDKPYYFAAADAVIISYTKQFLSTASLLWEACRFGTPAIASDNGQQKELMEAFQPGLLFTAQDADSLRETIQRFLSLKPEEIQVFKDNCRRFANEFSLERWAQRCLEIYDKMMVVSAL